jgi:hypothetical protein
LFRRYAEIWITNGHSRKRQQCMGAIISIISTRLSVSHFSLSFFRSPALMLVKQVFEIQQGALGWHRLDCVPRYSRRLIRTPDPYPYFPACGHAKTIS